MSTTSQTGTTPILEKLCQNPVVVDKNTKRKLSYKKYRLNNKDKVNKNRQQYTDNNPIKRMLWSAKHRAKLKNIPFDLKESDIVLPSVCPYLKVPLQSKSNRGEGRQFVYSLDRIDSNKGYVKNNVEVISHLANTMKNTATPTQLLEFANEIIKRYGKVDN